MSLLLTILNEEALVKRLIIQLNTESESLVVEISLIWTWLVIVIRMSKETQAARTEFCG